MERIQFTFSLPCSRLRLRQHLIATLVSFLIFFLWNDFALSNVPPLIPITNEDTLSALQIIDPNAQDLTADALDAVVAALNRWSIQPSPSEPVAIIGLRQNRDWSILTLANLQATTMVSLTEEIDLQSMFSVLLVRTPNGWQAAVDQDPFINQLLGYIPLSELSEEARHVLFLSEQQKSVRSAEQSQSTEIQQYQSYKFPWRSGQAWKMNQKFHGCCSAPGQKPGYSIDFGPFNPSERDILSAAPGIVKYVCNDGVQVYTAITTLGTNDEMLGYRHLDARTVPDAITGQCSSGTCNVNIEGITQGYYLGQAFVPPSPLPHMCIGKKGNQYSCYHSSCGDVQGLHLHLAVPTKPFVIDGESFDQGSYPTPPYKSSQTNPEDNPTEDDQEAHTTIAHFPDVPPTHPFFTYIETLYYIGAINGYSDGGFRPDNNITRGEAAKIIIRTMNEQYVEDELAELTIEPFPDVGPDNTFYPYIMRMKELGMTSGFSDGTFRSDAEITRGAVTKFLVIGKDGHEPSNDCSPLPFSDVQCTDSFYPHIRRLKEIFEAKGIGLGFSDGTFRADDLMTRSGIAKLAVVTFDWEPFFPDVQYTHPFFRYIQALFNRGMVSGFSDGKFKPDQNVTRGELAKMVTRGLGVNPSANDYPTATFPDIPRSHTFYPYIEFLARHGIISGYSEGQFKADELVTREQAAKFIVGALRVWFNLTCELNQTLPFTDVPADNPFYADIRCLHEKRITSGYSDNTYRPGTNLSRGAAAKFVYLAFIQRTPSIPQEDDNAANNQRSNAALYSLGRRYSLPSNDQDWVSVPNNALQAAATDTGSTGYQIVSTVPAGINADIRIEVYDDVNSNTPVAFESGRGSAGGTYMLWPVNPSTIHYLKLVNEKALVQEGTEAFLTFQPEPCPEDINDDNLIDIADIQQIAYRWNNDYGEPLYDWRHNLNADGLIDVADIQQTAFMWNVNCSARSQTANQMTLDASIVKDASSATTMQITPTSLTLSHNQQATIYIQATELSNFGGFDFELTFNPAVIRIDSIIITEFPGSTGRTFSIGTNNVDNNAGKVQFVAFSLGATPVGVNGSGNLVEIKLTALTSGMSEITFTKGQITTVTGSKLNPQMQNGTIIVQENGPVSNPQILLPIILSNASSSTQPTVPTATPNTVATQTSTSTPTPTPQPAFTATPTNTPQPASTPTPTYTSTATSTPTTTSLPTHTPTITPTSTPMVAYRYSISNTDWQCGIQEPAANIIRARFEPDDNLGKIRVTVAKCDGSVFSQAGRIRLITDNTNAFKNYEYKTADQIYHCGSGNIVEFRLVPWSSGSQLRGTARKCSGAPFSVPGDMYIYADGNRIAGPEQYLDGNSSESIIFTSLELNAAGRHTYQAYLQSDNNAPGDYIISGSVDAWEEYSGYLSGEYQVPAGEDQVEFLFDPISLGITGQNTYQIHVYPGNQSYPIRSGNLTAQEIYN